MEAVDIGYMVGLFLLILPYLFGSSVSTKDLAVRCLILAVTTVATFFPYPFVRREAYILISNVLFEINVQTLFCGKVKLSIPLNQLKAVYLRRTKVIFYLKDGTDKAIPRNALIAFRGYNNLVEKLESLASNKAKNETCSDTVSD